MTVEIIPVLSQDVYNLISLQARIWPQTCKEYLSSEQTDYMFKNFYNPEALKNDMVSGQFYMILYQDEEPQGFVSHSATGTDAYKLNKVFLLPEARGKGFGKKLISYVEDIARKNGSTSLELYVNRKNPAVELYQKMGFEITEEIDIPVGPYFMQDYKMRKTFA